jgi:acetate kinase
MACLALNIGSSTIKYAVFEGDNLDEVMRSSTPFQDNLESIKNLFPSLPPFEFVCHRIVHGGDKYSKPVLITPEVLRDLEILSPFAPLHQPFNIKGVRLMQDLWPDIPHYACFDTGFHAGHDELHSEFAIPKNLRDLKLRRYGFHGLSYQWISRQVKTEKVIVAHLGGGASLCALKNSVSIDSTMGLTALDGLPMSTRSGSIDAGLVLYLARNLSMTVDEIEHLLYLESGLKGLSGISSDFRTLISSDIPEAKFAINYFCFKTAQYIAMMGVSLGGIEKLVFTGGVGENSEIIRDKILVHLAWMPKFEIEVIKTNEEKMMVILVQEEFPNA